MRVIEQHYLNIYHKVFAKKQIKSLSNNGYTVLDKKFIFKNVNLSKYLNYSNYNFVADRKKLEFDDLKNIYKDLDEIGVISIIKNYFGSQIYTYDNTILTLGNKKCSDSSWQPHHDSKGRRLKVYIWLNEKNFNTHPLFYLRKSHKNIINWKKYEDTRFPNLDKSKFDTIYGSEGSIIIFDTHGIHSHFKTTSVPRSVIELTFDPYGVFCRLNKKNIEKEIDRLNLISLDKLTN